MATAKKLVTNPVTVSDKVRDYGNDPFVLKKNRTAKEFVKKYGLPKQFTSGALRKD